MKEKDKTNNSKMLILANKELTLQNEENAKRAAELVIINLELVFQKEEKEKRTAELLVAKTELAFQKKRREKRTAELTSANNKLKKAESDVRKLNTDLEQKVVKRSSQYAFISQVNQTIVHSKDAETLFQKSCCIALDFGKFKMAWIGSIDAERKNIKLLNSSGIKEEDIFLITDAPYLPNSPKDILLGNKKYYLCNDIQNSNETDSWKSFAAKQGLHSFIVLPIKKDGEIFGTFNLYSCELNFFDEEDIKLVIEVTGDISFTLDLFEKAKRQIEVEDLLLKNEKRFKALIENSPEMIALFTEDGKITYGSPSITELFGYSNEEILNLPAFNFIHPDDISVLSEFKLRLLQSPGKSFNFRVRLKQKNDNWIWCESTITNRLHEPSVNAIVSNFRDISEKKEIETKQEFDQNNLNALINNTNDLMWSVNKDFKLITFNKPFYDYLKFITGKKIEKGDSALSKSFSEAHLDQVKKYYERAFAGEIFSETIYSELPELSWTEISFYPIGEGDKIIGTACHTRDITKVKTIENQLSKSEEFNRGILNSLKSHIAVIDGSGKIIAVNESWNRFAKENGDSKLQHTSKGTNYFDICEKAGKSGDEIALEALRGMKATMDDGEKHFYLEYPCHAPKRKQWFEMSATKFEGNVPMIILVHSDISARKFAEGNLIQSEARLKEAQALSHISNWQVDLISGLNTWSEEFFTIYGYKTNEIKPSQDAFLALIHPQDYEYAKERIANGIQTLQSGSFNARIKRKDGIIRFISVEWKFEFDSNDKPIRLYGILQDITERKLAEQERERLTNELIQRNQDLEQFTFMISHNLRAPTANIMGFTEILQDEEMTQADRKQCLIGLSKSASGLDNVIKDINSILQVKQEVDKRKELICFSELVNDINLSLDNLIDKNQIEIKSDFSEIDEIFSLKAYFYSIFYNLISNSIKYSKPKTHSLIEIKSRKEKGKLILTFKDNGLGFDMKNKGTKVFGLYNRFHSHVEGKGMGLFMVKTQVEAIGGKITAESETDIGSLFTLEFNN